MKPTKIYFQKSFCVQTFLYEHYGAEILLEEGDSVAEAFHAAKNIVWAELEKNHPVFSSLNGKAVPVYDPENLPTIQEKDR
jgi:hypothetical protein